MMDMLKFCVRYHNVFTVTCRDNDCEPSPAHSKVAKLSTIRPTLIFFSSPTTFCAKAAGSALRLRQPLLFHTLRQPVRTYASKSKKKMPPKKAVKEEKILLGRPGNNLKSGIVCSTTNKCVLCAFDAASADTSFRSVSPT